MSTVKEFSSMNNVLVKWGSGLTSILTLVGAML